MHEHLLRVYYEDTDLAGVVYYANYLRFIERGRTEALRALGIDQLRLKRDEGLVFVVRRVVAEYLKPAKFDDQLAVATGISRLRGASLEMDQAVRRGEETLFTAAVTIACMDCEGRPARLPRPVRVALERLITGS